MLMNRSYRRAAEISINQPQCQTPFGNTIRQQAFKLQRDDRLIFLVSLSSIFRWLSSRWLTVR